jgi:8-oxo-dGTP pyrophosphatase MutT (NUDIX family)
MKKVAKLLIENNNKYLMMYRSNHPAFGEDPDLPGGTGEGDESGLDTMLREVHEEIGLHIDSSKTIEIFSGTEYSKNGTHYFLFITHLSERPKIVMSWEHSTYEWNSKQDFIEKAKRANDTYMHMAGDVLSR